MICYTIPYAHKWGKFEARKWANTPEEAADMVKAAHKNNRMAASVGVITYEKAVAVSPQPFSEEARAIEHARRNPAIALPKAA
jgi:hypothetical protein